MKAHLKNILVLAIFLIIISLFSIATIKALASNFQTDYVKMTEYGSSEVSINTNNGPYTISSGKMRFDVKFNVAGPIQDDWYWTIVYICSNQPIYTSNSSWSPLSSDKQTLTVGQACQIDNNTGGIMYLIPIKHGSTFSANCGNATCPFYSTGWSITTTNAKIKYSSIEVMDESRYEVFRENMLVIDKNDKNTQDIINDAQQNAQNIINNANQNTQDIIDNQNANSQAQIESQIACTNNVINKNSIIQEGTELYNNGTTGNSLVMGITDYIDLEYVKEIKIKEALSDNRYFCFYNESKVYIQCYSTTNYTVGETITIPNNAKYFRASINKNQDKPQFYLEICKNGNQAINDSLNQDHTYNNNASENIQGQNDLNNLEDAEDNLMDSLDFSGATDLDITINAQASSWIWAIVDRLRGMSEKIVLLFTSVLGMGIIKMVLNR